jgi:hypothetical protein
MVRFLVPLLLLRRVVRLPSCPGLCVLLLLIESVECLISYM